MIIMTGTYLRISASNKVFLYHNYYGGKLWHSKNLANDQKFINFSHTSSNILNYFKCVPVEPTTDK